MSLRHDLRYAVRTLRASPGFAALAIATIALTIGANTAMFSFVNGVLLSPLPYPDPERIVQVLEKRPDGGGNGISTLTFLDWAEQNTVFEHLAATTGWATTWTGGNEPIRLTGQRVSPEFFDISGAAFALGRKFRPDEDDVGNDRVVILSHTLWEARFGSDPDILGRDIMLDGEPHTVVGVLERSRTYDRSRAQLWKPLAFQPDNMTRDFHWFIARAKLKPGVTLEQARAEMDVIGARIADANPASNKGWGVLVEPLGEQLVNPRIRTAVLALFTATALVLLIGCANLANLALARGIARAREIAVRASLGAGRWRLARQFLTENLLLSLVGGAAGLGVGYAAMRWTRAALPPNTLPAEVNVQMDGGVLAFALIATLVTGVLFGLAPALQATRSNLVEPMKETGTGTTPGGRGRRVRGALVVAEIALAFVLLAGSGLLLRSLFAMLDVDPGFDSTNVLTAALPIANAQHPDPVELNEYLKAIRAAVGTLPGVRDTALTSALPLNGWGYGMPYAVAGRDDADPAKRQGGFFKMVSPSYFQTLRIGVIAGRGLGEDDRAGTPPAMVINETLAKREFGDESALGQRLLVPEIVPGKTQLGPDVSWEIVGVIKDEKINSLDDDESAGMYVSMEQSPVYFTDLVVRANVDTQTLERAVRAAVASVNKDQAVSDVRTLEQIADQSMTTNRVQTLLLGVFAGVALVLAAIGIYGVIAYAVTQRTHEMGIRAALGARAADLRRLVFRDAMRLALIGLVLGLGGSLVLGRLLTSLLYGVSARDPLTFAVVAIVLAAVAAAACFVPARRATKVDPIVALRYQ